MYFERFYKSWVFVFVFVLWALFVNVFYYLQFKDTLIAFLKKLGLL